MKYNKNYPYKITTCEGLGPVDTEPSIALVGGTLGSVKKIQIIESDENHDKYEAHSIQVRTVWLQKNI